MLVIDPDYRISIDEALKHRYFDLWYDPSEADGPAPQAYNNNVENIEHSSNEWKCLLKPIKLD